MARVDEAEADRLRRRKVEPTGEPEGPGRFEATGQEHGFIGLRGVGLENLVLAEREPQLLTAPGLRDLDRPRILDVAVGLAHGEAETNFGRGGLPGEIGLRIRRPPLNLRDREAAQLEAR